MSLKSFFHVLNRANLIGGVHEMLSEIILTVAGEVYGGENKGNPSESDK